MRRRLLRMLYSAPRFRGRDRIITSIADSFVTRPRRLRDGLTMQLDAAEWPQLELLVNDATEPATLRLIGDLVSSGDCAIDVGAHVGHHALCAARAAGDAGRVFAFDPQPYNADRIARNAELNGLSGLVTVCAAVGETEGFIRLPIQSDRDRSRLSLHERGPGDQNAMVEVPIRRLDAFMASHEITAVKLLKIDVEGYELEVMRGMGERISACQNIILEMLEDGDRGRAALVVDLLGAAGFLLRSIDGRAWQFGAALPENNLWAARA